MNVMEMIKFLILVALAVLVSACQAASNKVRPPAVAGAFYPDNPAELTRMIDSWLAKTAPPAEQVVGLVVPHAGYVYSGAVAAEAYAWLKGKKVERVVVISPSHVERFPFAAVYDGLAYSTPLGKIPVDADFAAALAKTSRMIQISGRGHDALGSRAEHALEVQLPFLQRVLGEFKLVPVVMGEQSYEICRALGLALAANIKDSSTVIVASSDLSHYHPYELAVKLDRRTLRAIEEWDYLSFLRNTEAGVWEACGAGPIAAAMIACERLGARQARLVKYANSGDTSGDRSRVVGYGAMVFIKGGRANSRSPELNLSPAEQAELFRIARASVEAAVRRKNAPEAATMYENLMQERGAFVTLREHGQLRGCIGYPNPFKPLIVAVRDVAAYAATRDDRFRPVMPEELPLLEYEISVLSPLRRTLDVNEIEVGRHGLLIVKGNHEGLLLPQVPVEQGWDRKTFLEQACLKAGLPSDAWKSSDTDIFSFTALVLEEPGRAGPVRKTERRD